MEGYKHHRLVIGIIAIGILIVGIFLGDFLAANLGVSTKIIDLEAIKIGLLFTIIILILIIGSLVLDIRDTLQSKKRGK